MTRCIATRPASRRCAELSRFEEERGAFDYESGGVGYAVQRRPDPRIAAQIHVALGPAETVVNVGAGAGSYEPADRRVVAVEPSATMRAQRPAGSAPVVAAAAEALPFRDDAFGAAMATLTVHHWHDRRRGLREMQRVSRGRVVLLIGEGSALRSFWLVDYFPELITRESNRFPVIPAILAELGDRATVADVPIPLDCTDGIIEAYYGRPERLLDPVVRRSQSAWSLIDADTLEAGLARLRDDLDSGAWDARWGELRSQPTYSGSLRLVVAGAG